MAPGYRHSKEKHLVQPCALLAYIQEQYVSAYPMFVMTSETGGCCAAAPLMALKPQGQRPANGDEMEKAMVALWGKATP